MRRTIAVLAALGLMLVAAAPQALAAEGPKKNDKDTKVQLLAFNDFHGNLEPNRRGRPGASPCRPARRWTRSAAVEYLATHIKQLREQNSNTITVGAGDLIGASPLISALFHDEPTIEAMNALGLDVSGVGNHEFDEGVNELLRMQFGGCHPVDGCQDGTPFAGALFQYLAANVFYAGTNQTILPPYEIEKVDNAKIAFIGLTLEGTPPIVTPAGVAGLEFRPEVADGQRARQEASERAGRPGVRRADPPGWPSSSRAGVPGPEPDATWTSTAATTSAARDQADRDGLDPQVDVVDQRAHARSRTSATSAASYVTSASSFGRLDHGHRPHDRPPVEGRQGRDGPERDRHARRARTRPRPRDRRQYNAIAGPIANRIVGSIAADITRDADVVRPARRRSATSSPTRSSPATAPTDFGGAVVAFMNPGGIRADLVSSQSRSRCPGR